MSRLIATKPASLKPADNSSRKQLGLVALAVLSSIIASSCCVLPLVLVLMGIGGAWMVNLTSLQPMTPLFIVIALGALAWAAYLIFRPAACAYPQDIACTGTRRLTRFVFFGGAAFIALLLLFPFIAPYFY